MNYKKLSGEEKQLARDIVAFIKAGALPREFEVMLSGEVINYDLPQLESKFSKGKLLALKNIERLFLLAEKQRRLDELLRLIERLIPGQDWLQLFED